VVVGSDIEEATQAVVDAYLLAGLGFSEVLEEHPPQHELLRPRDHVRIIVVPPESWTCDLCDPPQFDGARAGTVDWLRAPNDQMFGRCRVCGQKYVEAD
jgi:hypothetical protein